MTGISYAEWARLHDLASQAIDGITDELRARHALRAGVHRVLVELDHAVYSLHLPLHLASTSPAQLLDLRTRLHTLCTLYGVHLD